MMAETLSGRGFDPLAEISCPRKLTVARPMTFINVDGMTGGIIA